MNSMPSNTDLRQAVRSGDSARVDDLMVRGPGNTTMLSIDALRSVVAEGDIQKVQGLMARAAQATDPKLVDYAADRTWRVVQSYIREGDERKASGVLSVMPDKFIDSGLGRYRDEALGLSARAHMHNASSTLLAWGANPAAKDPEGITPLMHFASNGDHVLIEQSSRQLERTRKGSAASALSVQDEQGWNAAMYAVVSGAQDKDRFASLEVMSRFGHKIGQAQGKDGFTELHMAAGLGDAAMVHQLVDRHKINANVVSGNQLTPVMAAAYANEPGSITMLWSMGANLDVRRVKDGMSAAHMAAVRGNDEVLIELQKCGANLRLPTFESDQTPADQARFVNQAKTAKLIDQLAPPEPNQAVQRMAQLLDDALAPVKRATRAMGLGR